jgi:hypothetical protein
VGIFDFLKKGSTASGKSPAVDKKLSGPAKVAADKRAQTYDRMEAIQVLADMKSPDAAAVLLKRFTFSIDPSITDQEEKEVAFQGIVGAGKEAVPAVVEFCLKADTLTWPLKVLSELLDDDEYREELIALLERFDTEYARNVEPKLQVIMALEDVKHDEVRDAVERFLDDVNETVRFHAVQTTYAQQNRASLPKLLRLLVEEESVRVKNKIAEGLLLRSWEIPEADRRAAEAALQDTVIYSVGADGKIVKDSREMR